jgi:hypothetical protein
MNDQTRQCLTFIAATKRLALLLTIVHDFMFVMFIHFCYSRFCCMQYTNSFISAVLMSFTSLVLVKFVYGIRPSSEPKNVNVVNVLLFVQVCWKNAPVEAICCNF